MAYDGVTYRWIEMDYVAGRSLTAMLREGYQPEPEEALRLLEDMVAGAAAIWAAGTAHRDLFPKQRVGHRPGPCRNT
jgi:hypothetical protein